MDVNQTTPTPPAGPAPALRYDGRAGEIYPIFLMNLLLTIVTLGIFRFWAITRMRRYVWSRMSFQGQRLTYTGTGGELFVGFLLAGLVLAALFGAAIGAVYLLSQVDQDLVFIPMALLYAAILVLALGAPFSAQRYRLSRTEWCGIRGGMRGSMIAYGLRALLYWALVPLTLFQLTPWAQLRLAERRINASSFGTAPFRAQYSASTVYGRFLLCWIGLIVLAAVIAGVMWATAGSAILDQLRTMQATHDQPADGPAVQMMVQMIVTVGIAYVIFIVGAILIGALYQAFVLRHMADNTELGSMQFSGRFTAGGLLGLLIGNLLIMMFTLGFGYPFALSRSLRYVCNNFCATGTLDPATLRQTTDRAPRFGEGMFQQLDASGGML